MASLDKLAKNIRRFYKINTQRKTLEKEEEALKSFFKMEADGAPIDFSDKDLTVSVSVESRTSVDLKALRLEMGDRIKQFEETATVHKVSVRKGVA